MGMNDADKRHFDPEVNFRTHPFLNQLVTELEKDPDLVYSITQNEKPIVVILSPVAFERMKDALRTIHVVPRRST